MEKEKIREVIVEKKVGFSTLEVIIIIIVSIAFGAILGSVISYRGDVRELEFDYGDLGEVVRTYKNLTNDYYEKVDKEKLTNGAIKGMIESLNDPYTVYIDNEKAKVFNQRVNGEYYGIGTVIGKIDKKIVIVGIIKKSPADDAGLKPGDEILRIDNTVITEKMDTAEVQNLIKSDTKVKTSIRIRRDGEEKEIIVKKTKIDIPSAGSEIINKDGKKIGYLDLSIFAANTYEQFKEELNDLKKEGITDLVIDVRNNPGGHLDQVSKILSTFVPKGEVIYQIKAKGKKNKAFSNNKKANEYKIVVLVNGDSASASEILAAGLKESANAKIVGTKTYGKGTVQKAYSLASGAIVKYTYEEWLTPKGKSINKKGITPDVSVELDKDYYKDPTMEKDNQLQKALEILK